jgi:hypothetical protein
MRTESITNHKIIAVILSLVVATVLSAGVGAIDIGSGDQFDDVVEDNKTHTFDVDASVSDSTNYSDDNLTYSWSVTDLSGTAQTPSGSGNGSLDYAVGDLTSNAQDTITVEVTVDHPSEASKTVSETVIVKEDVESSSNNFLIIGDQGLSQGQMIAGAIIVLVGFLYVREED